MLYQKEKEFKIFLKRYFSKNIQKFRKILYFYWFLAQNWSFQVRNLRIREDTAKYLYNLNENAPYYDPKSRSMRENPFANVPGKEKEAAKFAGENFVK